MATMKDDGMRVYRCPECEFRHVNVEPVNRHEGETGHQMPITPDAPLTAETWIVPNRPEMKEASHE